MWTWTPSSWCLAPAATGTGTSVTDWQGAVVNAQLQAKERRGESSCGGGRRCGGSSSSRSVAAAAGAAAGLQWLGGSRVEVSRTARAASFRAAFSHGLERIGRKRQGACGRRAVAGCAMAHVGRGKLSVGRVDSSGPAGQQPRYCGSISSTLAPVRAFGWLGTLHIAGWLAGDNCARSGGGRGG